MRKLHKERLLKVARALRESPAPQDFRMDCYGNLCGTPACALGHYAARRDLQRSYTPLRVGNDYACIQEMSGREVDYADIGVEHFGLTFEQSEELFGGVGCGGAETSEDAAHYIECFVEEQS